MHSNIPNSLSPAHITLFDLFDTLLEITQHLSQTDGEHSNENV